MEKRVHYNKVNLDINVQKKKVCLIGPLGTVIKYFNGYGLFYFNNKIFFKDKNNFKVFNIVLKNNYVGVVYGYFIELNFIGLGYRFLQFKNFLLLKLGFSHYIKYMIVPSIKIIGYKRKLLIYGVNIIEVNKIAKQLRNFKKPSIYKGKGIQILAERIKLKIGKQK